MASCKDHSLIPALLERVLSHRHEFLKELHQLSVLPTVLLSLLRPLTMPVIPMCLSSGCAWTISAVHPTATVRHCWSTAGLPRCSAMSTAAWVLLERVRRSTHGVSAHSRLPPRLCPPSSPDRNGPEHLPRRGHAVPSWSGYRPFGFFEVSAYLSER